MRLLACSLASPGFLFPIIGLSRRLADRGHSVQVVTGRWAASLLACEGLPLAGGGPAFRTVSWHDEATVLRQYRTIRSALERQPADVILTSALALGPLLAGEALGIPVAVLGLLSPLWPTGEEEDDERHAELLSAWSRCRSRCGLSGPAPSHPLLGQRLLHRGLPGGSHPEPVRRVGAMLWEPAPDPEVLRWLDGLTPTPIYLHPGRTFGGPGFWAVARQALSDRPVAASVARLDQPRGATPSGWLVRPHVPMGPVLEAGAVVVASGTTTAGLGALHHGCPAVLIPGGSEQPAVARILAGEGIAEVLSPAGLTAARLRGAVERAEARRAEAARRRRDPAEDAVSLVEAMA